MNKVLMMGRLTRDPETRYSGDMAISRFSLAVDRRFKKDGQPEADFFNCTAFRKTAEFVEKYLRKGTKIVIEGSIQNDNYTNKEGKTVYSVQIVVDNIEFAESKAAAAANGDKTQNPATQKAAQPEPVPDNDGFMSIPDGIEDELPFS